MKTITAVILLITTPLAFGADPLPLRIEQNNHSYERCDRFTLRYGLIIKVAEIGWYAPNCDVSQPLTEVTDKIVRFHYLKDVSADFFKASAEEYFLLNLDNQAQQDRLYSTLKTFNSGYTDIKSGEYFDLVHRDNQKLSLLKNDQLLIAAEEPTFAHMYFNIWFGSNPVSKKLKRAFLN